MGDDRTRSLDFDPEAHAHEGTPQLEIVSGPIAARRIPIPMQGLVIGRGEDADLVLTADGVSRKHVRVINTGHGIVNVMDLGSTNGTFVNMRRIDVAVLREGDQLRVGQVVMRFGYGGDEPDARPAAAATTGPRLGEVLTARELEVARLVAAGLTNADIGKKLFISPRTVATHLANIYERLDIHSRAALATFVAQQERSTQP